MPQLLLLLLLHRRVIECIVGGADDQDATDSDVVLCAVWDGCG